MGLHEQRLAAGPQEQRLAAGLQEQRPVVMWLGEEEAGSYLVLESLRETAIGSRLSHRQILGFSPNSQQ